MNRKIADEIIMRSGLDICDLSFTLAIEYYLSKNRIMFLDEGVYELDPVIYGKLKGYMAKAIDISENEQDQLFSYFAIPVTIESFQSCNSVPISKAFDVRSLKSILTRSGLLRQDVELADLLVSRNALYGLSLYATFDLTRGLFGENKDAFNHSVGTVRSEGSENLFYVIGKMKGVFMTPCASLWNETVYFYEKRLSMSCGVDVRIDVPVKISDERTSSLLRGAWVLFANHLEKTYPRGDIDISEVTHVHLDVVENKETYSLDGSLLFCNSGKDKIGSVKLGDLSEYRMSELVAQLSVFSKEHQVSFSSKKDTEVQSRPSVKPAIKRSFLEVVG